MALFCVIALAGAYALQLCGELPDPVVLAVITAISFAAFLVPQTRLIGAFGSGFVLLAISSQSVIDDRLNPEFLGKTIKIDARVTDFPTDNGVSLRFLLKPVGRDDLPRKLRLSWFNAPVHPAIGETWQFELRLRRPRGFSNPGGFDYEGWLFRHGIGATGYVVNSPNNFRRNDRPVDRVSRLRHQVRSSGSGITLPLFTGDRMSRPHAHRHQDGRCIVIGQLSADARHEPVAQP